MTMIVNSEYFRTKKSLRDHVHSGRDVEVVDPALMPEWRKYGEVFSAHACLKEGDSIVVTNHPKRSWFASITKRNGKLLVE